MALSWMELRFLCFTYVPVACVLPTARPMSAMKLATSRLRSARSGGRSTNVGVSQFPGRAPSAAESKGVWLRRTDQQYSGWAPGCAQMSAHDRSQWRVRGIVRVPPRLTSGSRQVKRLRQKKTTSPAGRLCPTACASRASQMPSLGGGRGQGIDSSCSKEPGDGRKMAVSTVSVRMMSLVRLPSAEKCICTAAVSTICSRPHVVPHALGCAPARRARAPAAGRVRGRGAGVAASGARSLSGVDPVLDGAALVFAGCLPAACSALHPAGPQLLKRRFPGVEQLLAAGGRAGG